jgi:hypothetical protein
VSNSSPIPPPISRLLAALLLLWGISISAGFWGLWSYASTPGVADVAPRVWPADSGLARTPGRWTLVMFVHPHCPCTQASIAELERLQANAAGRIDLLIVSLKPSGSDQGWSNSPLVRRAAGLPGVVVVADADGALSRRFRARTSGETLLYDPAGRLAYHGGITAARGHEGDNPGTGAILTLVAGGDAPATCPAFGCPLFSDQESAAEATP